jgi:hypothetical protein
MVASARFGQASSAVAGYSVTFDTSRLLALTDRVTGQFRANTGQFQKALASVNERAAATVAQGMYDRLSLEVARRNRPQRGTDSLGLSILDEQNREVYANTFVVGKESWLERSPASNYWRGVESGIGEYYTKALFTHVNGPPWGGPYHRPDRKRDGLDLRMRQHKGPKVRVSAFDGYRYSRGGRDAFERFDIADQYEVALAAIGINMSDIPPRRIKK